MADAYVAIKQDVDADRFVDNELLEDEEGRQYVRQRVAALGPDGTALAAETTLEAMSSRFARLLKFEPAAGDEIRRDETDTDDYHGAAPDGTGTGVAAWDVVRFYKNSDGQVTRVRFRSDVAWDSRTVGW